MVELSKEVRKELRKEAISWVRVSVSVMSESITEESLTSSYYALCGKIDMCRYLGLIGLQSYFRLNEYVLNVYATVLGDLYCKNEEVA